MKKRSMTYLGKASNFTFLLDTSVQYTILLDAGLLSDNYFTVISAYLCPWTNVTLLSDPNITYYFRVFIDIGCLRNYWDTSFEFED